MTDYVKSINDQYSQANLEANILAALERGGKDIEALTREDITSFDEFHIRGRKATRELAGLVDLQRNTRVLDLGCGIGGAARTLAAEFECEVTGLDLVKEYCRTAEMLTDRVGLSDRVSFRHGDAMDMPFDDASFDVVWSQHTIMNIEDKARLFDRVRRVLRPEGRFVLFEVCAGSAAPSYFPVPWANEPSISFLTEPEALRHMLGAAGLKELMWKDVTTASLEWFRRAMAKMAKRPADAPPRPGLDLLMGASMGEKLANVRRNLEEDRIRVVQSVLAPQRDFL